MKYIIYILYILKNIKDKLNIKKNESISHRKFRYPKTIR